MCQWMEHKSTFRQKLKLIWFAATFQVFTCNTTFGRVIKKLTTQPICVIKFKPIHFYVFWLWLKMSRFWRTMSQLVTKKAQTILGSFPFFSLHRLPVLIYIVWIWILIKQDFIQMLQKMKKIWTQIPDVNKMCWIDRANTDRKWIYAKRFFFGIPKVFNQILLCSKS